MSAALSRSADRIRLAAFLLLFALMGVVWLWQLTSAFTMARAVIAALLSLPLLLPVRGMVRGERRTYGWATLCVIPYLVLGLTEVVANPPARTWAALCVMLAFASFVVMIAYLRVTRSRPGEAR